MGLKFQQADRVQSRAAVMLDTPLKGFKNQIMRRIRALQSLVVLAVVLCCACFVVYGSSLYFGAFVDVGEYIGNSQAARAKKTKKTIAQMPREKQSSLLTLVTEYFATDRFYMRRGQSVLVAYSLPVNSNINLQIQQCKMIPIIEVFRCTPVSDQDKSISKRTTGYVEFIASRPGFYHFQDSAMNSSRTILKANQDYRVVWQRGGTQAK